MKFSDIIIENKAQELTEKPMGFLKTIGNKVASTFGSGQAQGRLDTGKEANALRKDFDVFLGKTGQNPTGDLVIQFLQQKGYPTKSAQNFIAAGKPQAAEPATQEPTQAPQPAANPTAQQTTSPPQQDKAAIAARVKANVGKTAAATKGSNFGQPVQQPKPGAGAQAFGQMAQQLTKQADNPAQKPPAAQPAARAQGGGKVAGQLSQTPGAIKKRQARAVKKRTAHPADDNPNIQLGTESIKYAFESKLNYLLLKEEVLSGKQLDQIFLAAAQEKAKGGTAAKVAQPNATGQQSDQTGAPMSQLGQDPSADKSGGSSMLKHAAAAYDGMRGAGFGATKIGQEEPGKTMKDTSGRVPPEIVAQLNKLTNKQRAQLRKELDKA
jgi:hypothetical protein